MINLVCIPPSKDASRAASLVPQPYVDEMISIGTLELMTAIDVGVYGAEVYEGSAATCKWFNSEAYLNKFLEGLRERSHRVYTDLSDSYKEGLERLSHTHQMPSWIRHGLSFKRQLYALATHDAVERLLTRFESLGSSHHFVGMVQENGLTGRQALIQFASARESRRNNYRAVRMAGFWAKGLVQNFQTEMYDQSLRAFLGRGRFATSLGDYSRMYKRNWNFDDNESINYKAPCVMRADQLVMALEVRNTNIGTPIDRTPVRRTDAERAERNRSFAEAYGAGPSRLSRAMNITSTVVENYGVQAANMMPEGWVNGVAPVSPDPSPPTQDDDIVHIDTETNGDESSRMGSRIRSQQDVNRRIAERMNETNMMYVSTPRGDETVFERSDFGRSPTLEPNYQNISNAAPVDPAGWPTGEEFNEALSAGQGSVRFEMPEPTPTDMDLRARIARLAISMNVPETEIIHYTTRWVEGSPTPENLVSDPVFCTETNSWSAKIAERRPQTNLTSPRPGNYTYESI